MKKLKIGILLGGKSGEHEVSIVSALSIYKALNKEKYDVTLVGIDKSGRWLLPDQAKVLAQLSNPRLIKLNEAKQAVSLLPFPSEESLVPVLHSGGSPMAPLKFDLILPILHGTQGEDGTVQGLLELANIPYVGSGVLGSALGMDKDAAKRIFRDAGIPVVPFISVRKHEFLKKKKQVVDLAIEKFGLPFFCKPANMGSSVGVHKIKTREEALAKLEDAFAYDTKVLIEKAVEARELECAVLGNEEPKASIIGEIIPHHEFYTYEAKYMDENGAGLEIPGKDLSAQQVNDLQKHAVNAFQALECSGMARVDFFLDKKTGEIFLNEINTIPGFTSISMYPKLWAASGIAYPDLLDKLIELAFERHRAKNQLKTTYEPQS